MERRPPHPAQPPTGAFADRRLSAHCVKLADLHLRRVSHQVLETSLGYFINPLLSVALGVLFLRERLRAWQWVAVLIACVAVTNLALRGSGFPWIAVSLAFTFGFYGLVRKKVDINSLHGLLVETVLLLPVALLMMEFLPPQPSRPSPWASCHSQASSQPCHCSCSAPQCDG